MKKITLLSAAIAAFLCSSCGITRIVTCTPEPAVTVNPAYTTYNGYTTTVTYPRTKTVTTTTAVTPVTEDISLMLDLQAVGAAFAQSSTIQEFESLLNNSSYILSNLDLNADGYVDYLRVVETVQGNAHVFVIQAVLGSNIYQDVATVVAEVSGIASGCHVQIVGSNYLYGPNYIIEPVYIVRPVIYTYLLRPSYNPWRSPWYWNHYPSYYRHPAPMHLSHYQAYIGTYMRNHRYCHEFVYADHYHYVAFETVCRPICRNDYATRYPEKGFTVRNADRPYRTQYSTSAGSQMPSRTVVNARDIREMNAASTKTITSGRSVSSASASSSAAARSAAAAQTPTRSTASSASSSSSAAARTAASSSTPTRSTASSASSSTATRSAAATSSTATRSSAPTSSTTVRSSVRTTGSSSTTTKTVSPSGSSSTVRRPASSSGSSSSSTRSASGSSSTTRSAASSSSGSRTSSSTSSSSSSSNRTSSSSSVRR